MKNIANCNERITNSFRKALPEVNGVYRVQFVLSAFEVTVHYLQKFLDLKT